MPRAFLFILDSVGIGGAPDANEYGDAGSNTLGHIAMALAEGKHGGGDPLNIPNLERLGIGLACAQACGSMPAGLDPDAEAIGLYANAREISKGKDTPSGHWEICGVPVPFEWGYFPRTIPTFPAALTDALIARADLPGILGNKHASGTEIIAELGSEHIESGKPICYTSADSVFQIAAHETHFGLERLYALCEIARELVDPLNIGRVIARPFVGENPNDFDRTGNRRDYAVPAPADTLLDRVSKAGNAVIAVGKIDDIFAHRGPTDVRKATGNAALAEATLGAMADAGDGDLVMTNFVDFDQLYGHRRDVAGYAGALEAFDRQIPLFMNSMRAGDLMILTADHGNDPTWSGTDHTREQVPVLIWSPGITSGYAGARDSFCDIGATIAHHLGIEAGPHGKPILEPVR